MTTMSISGTRAVQWCFSLIFFCSSLFWSCGCKRQTAQVPGLLAEAEIKTSNVRGEGGRGGWVVGGAWGGACWSVQKHPFMMTLRTSLSVDWHETVMEFNKSWECRNCLTRKRRNGFWGTSHRLMCVCQAHLLILRNIVECSGPWLSIGGITRDIGSSIQHAQIFMLCETYVKIYTRIHLTCLRHFDYIILFAPYPVSYLCGTRKAG